MVMSLIVHLLQFEGHLSVNEVKTQNTDGGHSHQIYLNQSIGFDQLTQNKIIFNLLRFFLCQVHVY